MATSKPITIGSSDAGDVQLDVLKLVDTRCLIQANSGGGKSWLMRRLVEQTAKQVPFFILDPEGEFATLREKHDVVLAGRGGDVPCEPRSAALLARRLMELQVSAVIDLYELKPAERRAFVRRFCESLLDLPKSLWRPLNILIDEAHLFCPERSSGESEATDAIIGLMAQGRKRGFCGWLATQRLSKLHKDAEAEANNVFVGRTWLDIDQKRAANLLGLTTAEERRELRDLSPGEFFAFGPALVTSGVTRLQVGKVETTHPKAGERHLLTPPKPSKTVQKVAAELHDLPQQADEEARNLADAREVIRVLRGQLAAKPVPPIDAAAVDRARQAGVAEGKRAAAAEVKQLRATIQKLGDGALTVKQRAGKMLELICSDDPPHTDLSNSGKSTISPETPLPVRTQRPPAENRTSSKLPQRADGEEQKLGKAERAILQALYWLRDEQATAAKVGFYSNYSASSSTFTNALGRLRSLGLLNGWQITDAGDQAATELGTAPKPSGEELRTWLAAKLGRAERTILQALCDAHPEKLTNAAMAERSGYSASSSTFTNALGALRSIEAAEGYEKDGGTKASDVLFS